MKTGPSRTLIGAAAAFTIALFLFGGALLRAFGTDPVLLPPPAEPAEAADDEASGANPSLSADALRLAVENDPFTPERRAPVERYRLPGDVEPEPPPPPPLPPPPPAFRVAGTVVTGDAGMALISVGDVPPRMMSVGDALMGYRLSNVTAGTATMSNEDNDIVLRVPPPSRQVAVETDNNARNRNQRGGNTQQQGRQNAAPAMNPAMLQQLVERARAAGATPQMLESIMRMVSERGLGSIENLEIGPNGFTVRGNGGATMMRMQSAPARDQPVTTTRPVPRPRPDTMEMRVPRVPDLR